MHEVSRSLGELCELIHRNQDIDLDVICIQPCLVIVDSY